MNNELILKEMGERIYKRRREKKLTQEQVAEKMNVSTQMISNLELGKKAIRPENLIKICAVLDISADYILTGDVFTSKFDVICQKLSLLEEHELKVIGDIIDICIEKNWPAQKLKPAKFHSLVLADNLKMPAFLF